MEGRTLVQLKVAYVDLLARPRRVIETESGDTRSPPIVACRAHLPRALGYVWAAALRWAQKRGVLRDMPGPPLALVLHVCLVLLALQRRATPLPCTLRGDPL